jgi:protein-tyrosine phosphatase
VYSLLVAANVTFVTIFWRSQATPGVSLMSRKAALLRGLARERFKQVDKDLHEIIPGLFLGSCGAAHNAAGIQAAGVTHVLCVAKDLLPGVRAATAGVAGLQYLEIAVEDKPECSITDHFAPCFAFLDQCVPDASAAAAAADSNSEDTAPATSTSITVETDASRRQLCGGALVHCFQGKSRSTSVIVGYLMQRRGLSMDDALALVKSKRPVAAPNIGFALQLRQFERQLQLQQAGQTGGAAGAAEGGGAARAAGGPNGGGAGGNNDSGETDEADDAGADGRRAASGRSNSSVDGDATSGSQ